jgi:HPt (histidine-containing phosphotransfer) domain-containing protein
MVFKDLAARLGLVEDDFEELVELFVTTTFSDIEKIKDGVLNNNPKDASAASHSIKGASGNLGFDDIFTLTRDMEMQAKEENLDNFEKYISDLERMVNDINNM